MTTILDVCLQKWKPAGKTERRVSATAMMTRIRLSVEMLLAPILLRAILNAMK
jgi:hypothetical protein